MTCSWMVGSKTRGPAAGSMRCPRWMAARAAPSSLRANPPARPAIWWAAAEHLRDSGGAADRGRGTVAASDHHHDSADGDADPPSDETAPLHPSDEGVSGLLVVGRACGGPAIRSSIAGGLLGF